MVVPLKKVLVSTISAPCRKKVAVDLLDDVGPGDAEQVVVAFEIAFSIGKRMIAEIGLFQLVLLDHRAHRTIK